MFENLFKLVKTMYYIGIIAVAIETAQILLDYYYIRSLNDLINEIIWRSIFLIIITLIYEINKKIFN